MADNQKIGFNDVKESESNFKPTIDPGIHDNVSILDVELIDEIGSDPYCNVVFINNEGTREVVIRFFGSSDVKPGNKQASVDVSLGKAKHICNAVLSENDKTKLTGVTKIELLSNMLISCIGKMMRFKFTGEEYLKDNGSIGVRSRIGFPDFAESMTIPKDSTKLLFDINNKYDYKKVPVVDDVFKKTDTPTLAKSF